LVDLILPIRYPGRLGDEARAALAERRHRGQDTARSAARIKQISKRLGSDDDPNGCLRLSSVVHAAAYEDLLGFARIHSRFQAMRCSYREAARPVATESSGRGDRVVDLAKTNLKVLRWN
jgi:hypothetical protein